MASLENNERDRLAASLEWQNIRAGCDFKLRDFLCNHPERKTALCCSTLCPNFDTYEEGHCGDLW